MTRKGGSHNLALDDATLLEQVRAGESWPYLYRVIRSIASDRLRIPEDPTDQVENLPYPGTETDQLVRRFDAEATRNAFNDLPERWRSALWYTEVEQLKPREVAPSSVSALRMSRSLRFVPVRA